MLWRTLSLVTILTLAARLSAQTVTSLTWGPTGSGAPSGGSGTWDLTSLQWTANGGSTYQAWPAPNSDGTSGYSATFGGTAGTVSVNGAVSTTGLTFQSGYTLNITGGNSLTLANTVDGAGTLLWVTSGTATLNGPLSGTVGTTVAGSGSLVLSGASTLTGGITVAGGNLTLQSATGSLASGNAVIFSTAPSAVGGSGGTLILDNTGATQATSQNFAGLFAYAGDSTVESSQLAGQTQTLSFGSAGIPNYSRAATASVNFVVNGGVNGTTNQIQLLGFSPGFIDQGTFFNGSNYAYVDSGGYLRGINYGVDAGSITSAGATSLASTANVQITGDLTAQTTATFSTLNLVGSRNVAIASGNTLTVNGLLQSGGGTSTISGGTLQAAPSGATTVDFNVRTDTAGDTLTIASPLADNSGTALTKGGAGTLILTGANTYSGATSINAGTLQLGTGGTAGTLASSAGINDNGTLVINHSDAVALANYISGTGGVTQSGLGTTTLSGINTFSGSLVVSAGILDVTGDNSGRTGPATVTGGTLELGSPTAAGSGTVTLNGGTLEWGSSVTTDISSQLAPIGASGATFNTNGSTVTLATALTGSGSVTKTGSGTLTLSANNTFTGAAVVSGGTLVLSGANTPSSVRLNSGTLAVGSDSALGSGTVTLTAGTLQSSDTSAHTFTNSVLINGGGTIGGSGALTFGALTNAATDTLTVNNSQLTTFGSLNVNSNTGSLETLTVAGSGNVTVTGAVTNGTMPGSLTKSGTGTLTLLGTGSYSGTTTVSGGILALGTDSALGAANLILNGGTIESADTNARSYSAKSVSISATSTIGGAGALTFGNVGNNKVSDTLNLNDSQLVTFNTLNLASGANSTVVTLAGAGNLWVANNVTNTATGGLTMSGTGTVTLNGTTNSFKGALTVNSGTLVIAGTASAASSATLAGGTTEIGTGTSLGGGTVTLKGGTLEGIGTAGLTVTNSLSLTASPTLAGSTPLSFTGAFSLTGSTILTNNDSAAVTLGSGNLGTHPFTVTGSGATTVSGVLSGTAGSLIKSGAGTLTLGGANTYAAGTILNAGTLIANSSTALGISTSAVTVNGGTLNLNSQAIPNAILVNSGSLTNLSAYTGTQTLKSSQSYSGTVGGSVIVASGGALNTTGATFGAVTVNSGGALSGTGTVGAGSTTLTVNSGATFSPGVVSGSAPGTLAAGNVQLNGGSYVWQLTDAAGAAGTGSSLLQVTGTLTIGATSASPVDLKLESVLGGASGQAQNFNPNENSSFTLAQTTGGVASFAANEFSIDSSGFENATNGTWSVSESGNNLTLNYTTLSAVPEPSTWGLIAGSAALLYAITQRKRRLAA